MGDNSKIEWTDATWNPVAGCSHVSEGCRHCYAEALSLRQGWTSKPWTAPNAPENVKLHPDRLDMPLRWRRPRRIFVNSMSDLFHEQVPDEFIASVFRVMSRAPRHTFQILTKRPQRMMSFLSRCGASTEGSGGWLTHDGTFPVGYTEDGTGHIVSSNATSDERGRLQPDPWPLPNVWLGVSVEDQRTADERIPLLLQTPAAVRWTSAEPLLGPVDFRKVPGFNRVGLDLRGWWVVVGGESGPKARPMHPDWVRVLRGLCLAAKVPFYFKQWGEWMPVDQWDPRPDAAIQVAIRLDGSPVGDEEVPQNVGGQRFARVGKKAAGRELDGQTWEEWPR